MCAPHLFPPLSYISGTGSSSFSGLSFTDSMGRVVQAGSGDKGKRPAGISRVDHGPFSDLGSVSRGSTRGSSPSISPTRPGLSAPWREGGVRWAERVPDGGDGLYRDPCWEGARCIPGSGCSVKGKQAMALEGQVGLDRVELCNADRNLDFCLYPRAVGTWEGFQAGGGGEYDVMGVRYTPPGGCDLVTETAAQTSVRRAFISSQNSKALPCLTLEGQSTLVETIP